MNCCTTWVIRVPGQNNAVVNCYHFEIGVFKWCRCDVSDAKIKINTALATLGGRCPLYSTTTVRRTQYKDSSFMRKWAHDETTESSDIKNATLDDD